MSSASARLRAEPPLGIVLERMRRSDLAAVVELERRTFAHPWTARLFLRELRLPFSKIVVARSSEAGEGRVVGYICRWLRDGDVEIQNVAVHPDWRRRSIARSLVESVLAEAAEVGAERVLLEARRHNQPAIDLYRSLGFVETGIRRRYYADGEDALLMERRPIRGDA